MYLPPPGDLWFLGTAVGWKRGWPVSAPSSIRWFY